MIRIERKFHSHCPCGDRKRETRRDSWKQKPMQCPRQTDAGSVRSRWLEKGVLRNKTEGLIMKAQDQAQGTNAAKVNIDNSKGQLYVECARQRMKPWDTRSVNAASWPKVNTKQGTTKFQVWHPLG